MAQSSPAVSGPVESSVGRRACGWTNNGDPEFNVWDTGCGEAFQFSDGGPAANYFRVCPFCGGRLSVESKPQNAGQGGWMGPGYSLTNTRIFNHFHRTFSDAPGDKRLFSEGVRWAEKQHRVHAVDPWTAPLPRTLVQR